MRYKNPFGAAITATFGVAGEAAARAVLRRREN
jgi:hypothetical protein